VAGLATAATIAAAAPASAARLFTPDGTGDNYATRDGVIFTEAGSRTNTDVIASAVRHTRDRINASVGYDDLVRSTDVVVTPVRVHASNGKTYLLKVKAGPGDRDGTASLLRYTGHGAQTARVACSDVRHVISYADNLVAVNVPRSCLGYPSWIEYGGTVRAVDESGTVFTDTLLDGGPVNDLYSERIKRG
jgi:hypothetical protein